MENRYLAQIAFSDDFGRQMRFIAGPRQCGKTFLARRQLESLGMSSLYYTWDDRSVREAYRRDNRFIERNLGSPQGQSRGIILARRQHWEIFLLYRLSEKNRLPSNVSQKRGRFQRHVFWQVYNPPTSRHHTQNIVLPAFS